MALKDLLLHGKLICHQGLVVKLDNFKRLIMLRHLLIVLHDLVLNLLKAFDGHFIEQRVLNRPWPLLKLAVVLPDTLVKLVYFNLLINKDYLLGHHLVLFEQPVDDLERSLLIWQELGRPLVIAGLIELEDPSFRDSV